jgi:hypothetical protein
MFPRGFHPVKDLLLHDIITPAPVIPRRDVGVKYYYVDYGISSYFPTGPEPRLVLGRDGRDQDVPELSDEVPYDPFKVDIFTIGNVLGLEFCNVSFFPPVSSRCLTSSQSYTNLDFLKPLVVYMSRPDPSRRPSAEEALQQWRTIRGEIGFIRQHWRLRDKAEPFTYGLILDIFYVVRSIVRFVGLTS